MNKKMIILRKIASSLALLMCLLMIAGCGSDNADPTTVPTSEAIEISTEDTTRATEPQDTTIQETTAPTTPPEAKPVLVDVYADENCLIQFYTVEKDSKYYIAKFRVTNYTSRTLTFQSGCISFNGESTNNITLSDEIAPNSAGTIEMKLRDLDMDYFDIQNIHKISGSFKIIDFNDDNFHDGKQSYRIKYIDVEVPCNNVIELSVYEGTLLYDDEKVAISYLRTQQGEDYTYAYFRVKNKTTEIVTIQCKGLALNGESATNVVCSEDVAPLSTGNIELKCTIDTTFVDLSNITTLSGMLRVIAFDNDNFHDGKQSYSATFQFPVKEPISSTENDATEPATTEAVKTESATYDAYIIATTLTKKDLRIENTSTGRKYYYQNIPLLSEDVDWIENSINKEGTVNQGAIYRKLAKLLVGYTIRLNNGNSYSKYIFGDDITAEKFSQYAPIVAEFITEEDSLYHILKKFESLECVEGNFDYANNIWSFTIDDLTQCASEMQISEEMLGYIFAFLDEYAPTITFKGNSCSFEYNALFDFGFDE